MTEADKIERARRFWDIAPNDDVPSVCQMVADMYHDGSVDEQRRAQKLYEDMTTPPRRIGRAA